MAKCLEQLRRFMSRKRDLTLKPYEGKGSHPYRWKLISSNGNIIADSGEGYTRMRDARRAGKKMIADIKAGRVKVL